MGFAGGFHLGLPSPDGEKTCLDANLHSLVCTPESGRGWGAQGSQALLPVMERTRTGTESWPGRHQHRVCAQGSSGILLL